MAKEATIHDVLEVIHDLSSAIASQFEDMSRQMNERFDRVEDGLDRVEGRLDKVEGKLDRVEKRLDSLESASARHTDAIQNYLTKSTNTRVILKASRKIFATFTDLPNLSVKTTPHVSNTTRTTVYASNVSKI
ncbi:MAG: hypothetical protein WAU02_00270 [Candidatus Saccharimonadales bacterium]